MQISEQKFKCSCIQFLYFSSPVIQIFKKGVKIRYVYRINKAVLVSQTHCILVLISYIQYIIFFNIKPSQFYIFLINAIFTGNACLTNDTVCSVVWLKEACFNIFYRSQCFYQHFVFFSQLFFFTSISREFVLDKLNNEREAV